jgi:hypothetical protein
MRNTLSTSIATKSVGAAITANGPIVSLFVITFLTNANTKRLSHTFLPEYYPDLLDYQDEAASWDAAFGFYRQREELYFDISCR